MNNIWNKRIPTLFGLLVIIFGIGITSFLTKQGVIFTGQASPSDEPKNVRISNITDTSFTVSYTTDGEVLGSLNVGQSTGLGTIVVDDRDKTPTAHKAHIMTVNNLKPQTSYLFSIISGPNTYLKNGVLYDTKTGPVLDTPLTPQSNTISGKVIMPDGSDGIDTIIYLDISGAQTLSALTKANGSYSIPLSFIRTTNLSTYYDLLPETAAKISIFGNSLSSQVSVALGEMNEIPTITLSQNYDFTISQSPLENTATSSANQVFPSAAPSSSSTAPQITTPKQDQSFSDDKPLFRGKAGPSEDVEITIHSDDAISAKVVADTNGNWTYRPESSLTPGVHTITIKTKDAFGILKTISQQFTVYAAGSQVGQTATPSATLTPIPTLTITVTPTTSITPVATITPTEIIYPTETPISTATPTAILPASGSSSLSIVGLMGAALVAIGTLLFIFTHIRI